jgi:hypothetical protein
MWAVDLCEEPVAEKPQRVAESRGNWRDDVQPLNTIVKDSQIIGESIGSGTSVWAVKA